MAGVRLQVPRACDLATNLDEFVKAYPRMFERPAKLRTQVWLVKDGCGIPQGIWEHHGSLCETRSAGGERSTLVARSGEISLCGAWHIMAATDESCGLDETVYVAREDRRACRCAKRRKSATSLALRTWNWGTEVMPL
ncbi:hypothetical protein BBP40_002147 [Aspergillus hancockii]|nr:hypothetical protein BBP40_002147 [Aspergillus hancockii]